MRYPRVPDNEVTNTVTGMIASVAREHGGWFWRGVGALYLAAARSGL